MIIKDLFVSLFVEDQPRKRRKANVDEVNTGRKRGQATRKNSKARTGIVISMNRVMGAICLLSFAYIAVFPFIGTGREFPDILGHAFTLTLGYFGSSIVTFLEK